MATILFTISYSKNEDMIISPSELIEQYLYGISLCNKDGTIISSEAIKQKILSAGNYVSHFLELQFSRKFISESTDFIRSDYQSWGYMSCSFPVVSPISLKGFVGTVKQIEYPIEWCSKSSRQYEEQLFRKLHIVPAGNTTTSVPASVIFSGITPHLGFLGYDSIPNYWQVSYTTGFSKVPPDIIDFIGKLAAIEVLAILGDIVIGAGISNFSLGLDGLSQSISSTKSGGGAYAGRIKQYTDELVIRSKYLRDYYKGLTFGCC